MDADRALTVRASLVAVGVASLIAVTGCGGGAKAHQEPTGTSATAPATTASGLTPAEIAAAVARRRAARSAHAVTSGASTPTSQATSPTTTASSRELARSYGEAAVAFEKTRQDSEAQLASQTQSNQLRVETGCPQLTRGAAQERGFALTVEATVIDEDRLVGAAYRNFSTALVGQHPSDPVLARAAQDSVAMSNQLAVDANMDDDPCALARNWQAAGWSPGWFQSVQLGAAAGSNARLQGDASAAASRLEELGVSRSTAEQFAAALTILSSN